MSNKNANLFSALEVEDEHLEATTVPVSEVHVDALVALKIAKHANDNASSSSVTGALLGMDADGVLQVTASYPYLAKQRRNRDADTNNMLDEEDQAELDENYQLDMLKCLRAVNADANTVGWYHASSLNNFLYHSWVSTQTDFQTSIVNSVVLEYDPAGSQTGAFGLRAFRLTDEFLTLFKGKPRSAITSAAVTASGLIEEGVLVELPVSIRNSQLASAFLYSHRLTAHTVAAPMPGVARSTHTAKHAAALLDTLDAYGTEQSRYSGWHRVHLREKGRAEQQITRKRNEADADDEQVEQLRKQLMAKLPTEPPKLDSILLAAQLGQSELGLSGFLAPAVLEAEIAKAAGEPAAELDQ
ncbi:hypothetical protein BC828DRAFT_368559 [Blastocladiella britannica]|nr:hypothetical protein BC828DRAFT_368559 [Blastocladiella britannica]